MLTEIIGYLAGVILTLCYLPQIIKTFRLKHADDVSMWMLVLTIISTALYEVYAWQLGLMPVVVMNGIFGILVTVEIIMKIRYAASISK